MTRPYSNRERPFHLGEWPFERLPRQAAPSEPAPPGDPGPRGEVVPSGEVPAPSQPADALDAGHASIAHVLPEYLALYARHVDGPVAPKRAPVPDDLAQRAENLKATAWFLDASLAGGCTLDSVADRTAAHHSHAFVVGVEFGRAPPAGAPGADWTAGADVLRSDLRAAEIAIVVAGYLRALGFSATAHFGDAADCDLPRLAIRAGVARKHPRHAGDSTPELAATCATPPAPPALEAPFLARGFRLAAVTTDYAFEPDRPLLAEGPLEPSDPGWWFGVGGTRPGTWYAQEARRPVHLGRYPMETLPRVPEPTTLVLRDEIRRVPKRADFFTRAMAGDLGERAQRERQRFALKHPLAMGMRPLIGAMVPLQGSREPLAPTGIGGPLDDAARNTEAIRALAYWLGADLVGICAAEPWMWYSHDHESGSPIEPYHRWAVVMLIDQGYETMEGASGDDWISGCQSMRAYVRGAQIAGVMGAHLRRLGVSSRAHSNAHSEILHIPAVLMAGLGELSRIGETVLNPFIGPRSKSVVLTTDLPLLADQPIDFGLQSFCERCHKCARECPCNAIPFGPKVMFNGYEIWKPDVEKCAKYRVTNMRGSACGRCMKMCPWNREDTDEQQRLARLSVEHPEAAPRIVAQDDVWGSGERNPAKRWWFDLEVVDGVCVAPAQTNERDLTFDRAGKLAAGQKLAMFPPSLQPPGGSTMTDRHPVDRAAGLAAYAEAEPPLQARERRRPRD